MAERNNSACPLCVQQRPNRRVAAKRRDVPGADIRIAANSAALSGLKLALEVVPEMPIRSLGDDLVGRRLDHADFAQAQRIEPQGIRWIVCAPLRVWNFLEHPLSVVEALDEPSIDDFLRGAGGLGRAEVGRLKDRAQDALGCYRMLADEVPVARQHTAE